MLDQVETARLTAERITSAHFDELAQLYRDPQVMKTLSADGKPLTDEAIRGFIERAVENWRQHGFGAWMFRERTTGRFVGRGGLHHYQVEGQPVVGLLYAVLADRWKEGFATEMAEASVRFGFERLGLAEVASWTLPHNFASRRVMEKIGFRYERDFVFADLPHRLYRLLAADFAATCP